MYYQKRTDTTFACPVVGRRELEYRQKMHRDKIQRMTSAIDTRPPAPQPHLTLYGRDYVAKKRATTEAAFADLKMIQSIARTMTRPLHLPDRKGPVSLNSGARKQEIFRVMHENHRLLNSLETLDPVVNTKEFTQSSRWRQRYIINCSHSKRLSGEYDHDIEKFAREDRDKLDKYRNTVELRRAQRMRNMEGSGSVSMPTLVPPVMGGSSASDQYPGEKKFKRNGGSHSAGSLLQSQPDDRIDNSAPRQEEAADSRPSIPKRKTSVVHFDVNSHEPDDSQRQPKTPHPSQTRSDSKEFEEFHMPAPDDVPQTGTVEEVFEEAPVILEEVAASEEAQQEAPVILEEVAGSEEAQQDFGVDAPAAERPTEVGISGGATSGAQEFDPSGQSGAGDDEYELDFDQDDSALSAGGATGTLKATPKKKETFEPFEEEDENEESATFEKSQSDGK